MHILTYITYMCVYIYIYIHLTINYRIFHACLRADTIHCTLIIREIMLDMFLLRKLSTQNRQKIIISFNFIIFVST